MNTQMGMVQDTDITTVNRAVDAAVLDKYNAGRISEIDPSELPQTAPMRLDLHTKGGVSAWNQRVWLEFRNVLNGRVDVLRRQDVPLPSAEKAEDLFYQRIDRLGRLYVASEPRSLPDGATETPSQIRERVEQTAALKRGAARRATRRQEVFAQPHAVSHIVLTGSRLSFTVTGSIL